MVNGRNLANAKSFVLSIEPTIDTDPAPAPTKLLSGLFVDDEAMVSSTELVGDFTDKTGSYILATPTDTETDLNNQTKGLWFVTGSITEGLSDLPALNAGWKYEGWVVVDGTPISTGTFSDTGVSDDNAMTNEFGGTTGTAYSFPGEDFLNGMSGDVEFNNDFTLLGQTVVISVEPNPDNSPAPFALKPLAGMIPAGYTLFSTLTMDTTTGPALTTLTGTVTR